MKRVEAKSKFNIDLSDSDSDDDALALVDTAKVTKNPDSSPAVKSNKKSEDDDIFSFGDSDDDEAKVNSPPKKKQKVNSDKSDTDSDVDELEHKKPRPKNNGDSESESESESEALFYEDEDDDDMADFIVDDDASESSWEKDRRKRKARSKRKRNNRNQASSRRSKSSVSIVNVEQENENEEEARENAARRQEMAKVLSTMESAKASKVLNLTSVPETLKATLYSHQHQCLTWCYMSELEYQCGMLCDDQGLGKTIEAITLILKTTPKLWVKKKKEEVERQYPEGCPLQTLCVLPISLLKQWKAEINKFTGGTLKVAIYHSDGDGFATVLDNIDSYDIILTTYSIVRLEGDPKEIQQKRKGDNGKTLPFNRENELLMREKAFNQNDTKTLNELGPLFRRKWFRVICDESHIFKNSNTSTYRACCRLVSLHRWCLTGTPIHNSMDELYSQLSFLYNVSYAKTKSGWTGNISKPIDTVVSRRRKNQLVSGRELQAEQQAWRKLSVVVNTHIIRRTKFTPDPRGNICLVPLPNKRTFIRRIPLGGLEKELYMKLYECSKMTFNNAVASPRRNKSVLKHVFVWLLRLRQFCNHPLLVGQALKEDAQEDAVPDEGREDADSEADETAEKSVETGDEQNLASSSSLSSKSVVGKNNPKKFHHKLLSGEEREEEGEVGAIEEVETEMRLQESVEGRALDEFLVELKARELTKHTTATFWPSAKMSALFEDLLANRSSTSRFKGLIFSQFTSFIHMVEAALGYLGFVCVRLDGTMNQNERAVAIEKFRSDPLVDIFIISLRAGGLGLNLVMASHVYILDPWWSCSLEDQAVDRVHRIGQVAPVMVTRYIVDESIETDMLNMQEKKRALTSGAFGEKAPDVETLSLKDLYNIFRRATGKEDETSLKKKKRMKEQELQIEQDNYLRRIQFELNNELLRVRSNIRTPAGLVVGVDPKRSPPSLSECCIASLRSLKPEFKQETLEKIRAVSQHKQDPALLGNVIEQLRESNYTDNGMASVLTVAKMPRLWLDGSKPRRITSKLLNLCAKKAGEWLVSLHLERCQELTVEHISRLGVDYPVLRELRLICCGHVLDVESVERMLSTLHELERLELSCAYKLVSIDSILCKKKLKEISVPHTFEAQMPTDEISRLNWESLETLERLDLSHCINLMGQRRNHKLEVGGSSASSHITTLPYLFSKVRNLKVLKIAGFDEHQFSMKATEAMASNLLYLKELDLSQCAKVLSFKGFFHNLFRNCPGLEILKLSKIIVVTSKAKKTQQNDQEFKIRNMTIASLVSQDEEAVARDKEEFAAINEKASSERTEADSVPVTGFKKSASKSAGTNFAQHNMEMQQVDLATYQDLSTDRNRAAAKSCLLEIGVLKELKELDLTLVDVVDDQVLKKISISCRKLRTIVVNGCSALTIAGLRSLVNLKGLEHVDISWCSAVTNDLVKNLLEELPALSKLFLWGCSEIDTQKLLRTYASVKHTKPNLQIWI